MINGKSAASDYHIFSVKIKQKGMCLPDFMIQIYDAI